MKSKAFELLLIASFLLGLELITGQCFKELYAGDIKTLEGQVLDKEGRPVSQYPVKIEAVGAPSAKTYAAVTDFSGTFRLYNLPPGKYLVYPVRQPRELGKTIEIKGLKLQRIEPLKLGEKIAVNINPEASKVINPGAAKTINPEAAKTINPHAAKTINAEAAKTLNPEAAKVLHPERAKILTQEKAKTISPAEASSPPSM